MRRRTVLSGAAGALALAGGGIGGYMALTGQAKAAWEQNIAATRRPIADDGTDVGRLVELVRYGTLAANSHNTQAWRFVPREGTITIVPDFSRRTPNVDPDDHHLFASIGAAAENIVQAAPLLGLSAAVEVDVGDDAGVSITLHPAAITGSALADAIAQRQCTRTNYDAQPVPAADLSALSNAAGAAEVEVMLVTERPSIAAIGALIIEGNTAQMNDPAYIAELKHWLRFSYGAATSSADGLFSATTGNPVLPDFLGQLLFPLVATANAENAKYQAQIDSSSGLAIFVSAHNDRAHWIAAGRSYQRFALQATALGIRHAFLNQAVEVPAIRQRLADHLGLGGRRPDLIVRFGYAPPMPFAMRRPVDDVIA